MTIIKDISTYQTYPYEAMSAELVACLAQALGHPKKRSVNSILKSLECFLQITDQALSLDELKSNVSDEKLSDFIGALLSPQFRILSHDRRVALANNLQDAINTIRQKNSQLDWRGKVKSYDIYSYYRGRFEALTLNSNKVYYWTGWHCKNVNDNIISLPLRPVYINYGRAAAEKLYEIGKNFHQSRRTCSNVSINAISRFLEDQSQQYTAYALKDRSVSTDFFTDLWIHYYKHHITKKSGHANVVSRWRNIIRPFILEHIVPSNIFGNPYDIPDPKSTPPQGADSNIITELDREYKNKLIIRIPLEIPDEEAFARIRADIYSAHNLVMTWCESKISAAMTAYTITREMAETGSSVKVGKPASDSRGNAWLLSKDNPEALANLAATFSEYGYAGLKSAYKNFHSLFPKLPTQLGLPNRQTLLPFCIKLITSDPRITPAFLASVELYDSRGMLKGLENSDTPQYIHGYKDRKHADSSEMRIKLTSETATIVASIIALTNPLREFLRSKNDDTWRKLLISTPKGLGKPLHYTCKTNNTEYHQKTVCDELTALAPDADTFIIQQLSKTILRPATMRSTAAVITFLETGSVYSMAEALGHNRYDPDLLERYLPPSILYFFRDRWVRKFQTGIIVQALKGSPYLLDASGFNSMGQLESFLELNCLAIPDRDIESRDQSTTDKALVNIDPVIARAIVTLTSACPPGKKLNSKAQHWADFSQCLLSYLNSDPENNLEILELIDYAKALGPDPSIEEFIYG